MDSPSVKKQFAVQLSKARSIGLQTIVVKNPLIKKTFRPEMAGKNLLKFCYGALRDFTYKWKN